MPRQPHSARHHVRCSREAKGDDAHTDNAGCYRSGNTILDAVKAGEACGIQVRRLDFSNLQGGKEACNRKAATIKAHIKTHLNEGHDVETASQMVDAMQSSRLCQFFPSGCATTLSPVLGPVVQNPD